MRSCQLCGAIGITEEVRQCCLGGSQLDNLIIKNNYYVYVIKNAIKVLGEYLPPDGIPEHETLSRLLEIFDNEEIIKKLACA